MRDGRDDLQRIMDEALEGMAREAGRPLDLGHINLAEFCRRTGLTRQRARTIKRNGSGAGPRGLCGRSPATTVPGGYTGFVDDQPGKGPADSQVVFDKLVSRGHAGGPATAEAHVSRHRDLVPPQEEGGRVPGQPRAAVPGCPRRGVPDGLGVCRRRRSRRCRGQRRLLLHGMPPLRHALRRPLPQCEAGEPVYRDAPRLHGPRRPRARSRRQHGQRRCPSRRRRQARLESRAWGARGVRRVPDAPARA